MIFTNASASVIGYSHYKLYCSNQDGYHFFQNKSCVIGVVADGLIHLNERFFQGESVEGMTSLSDFFDNEDFFDAPASLPAFLTGLSLDRKILRDDTTMIMLKR